MSALDMNAMVASIYKTVLEMQNTATELIGLDCMWCRALPYQNGEDIIVQEYTLSNVECPKQLKVITDKADYQVGLYTFGPLGIDFDSDMQISINISTWEGVYGKDTMPQKGDIVIIPIIHRAFQVSSSEVVYTLAAMPTSYKCVLAKYQRQASRRESSEFQESIDELTNSQDRLFGDDISKEVADTVMDVETSYNQTTTVDPFKDFDIDCVTCDTVKLCRGNIVAEAYYDFSKASKNVDYNVQASYKQSAEECHWIFSCWFNSSMQGKAAQFKFINLYLKEKSYWYFTYKTSLKLEAGDTVTLKRGTLLELQGEIDSKVCADGLVVKIATSDVMRANKKLTGWYVQTGVWTIEISSKLNLFKGYDNSDSVKLAISSTPTMAEVQFGTVSKRFKYEQELKAGQWTYIAADMTQGQVRVVMAQAVLNEKTGKYKQASIVDDVMPLTMADTDFSRFACEMAGQDVLVTNIRLYESEYPLEDTYKKDMYSQVTRNASKLMVVDTPNPANKMRFISPLK